jgi:hypothetical protein
LRDVEISGFGEFKVRGVVNEEFGIGQLPALGFLLFALPSALAFGFCLGL